MKPRHASEKVISRLSHCRTSPLCHRSSANPNLSSQPRFYLLPPHPASSLAACRKGILGRFIQFEFVFPACGKLRERARCSVPPVSRYQSPGEFSWVTVFLSTRSAGKRAGTRGERRESQSLGSPHAVGGVAAGDGTEVPISPPQGSRCPSALPREPAGRNNLPVN